MKPFLFLAFVLLLCGASNCSSGVKKDTGMSALVAGDYTAPIEGCGNQLVPGYTYCRVTEGDASDQLLYLVGPPSECEGDGPCVFYKVFFPTGEPTLGGAFPRGETRVGILWSDLIKRSTFEKGDRGFWPFVLTIHWIDTDGRARETKSQGEIRLRVMSKTYTPLHNVMDDSNFVWAWVENKTRIRMTTGARTWVGLKLSSSSSN